MKIEDLIPGKNDDETISIEGISIPVSAVRNLIKDGYVHIRPYPENKSISVWGKSCTGCFTEQELKEKA